MRSSVTRTLVSATAVLAVLGGTLGAAAPATAAVVSVQPVKAGAHGNAYSRTAFNATNAARRDHDLATLRGNACLRKAALRQVRAMARAGELFHQDMGRIQADCGVGWVGENVAYGYGSGSSVVNDGWMNSSGHRANILGANYNRMGVAAIKRDGTWWAAQVFGSR